MMQLGAIWWHNFCHLTQLDSTKLFIMKRKWNKEEQQPRCEEICNILKKYKILEKYKIVQIYNILEKYKILEKHKILEKYKILEICKIKIMQLGAFCWQNFCHLTQLDSTKHLIIHSDEKILKQKIQSFG